MLSYGQQGWGVGGYNNLLDEYNTGPTEVAAVVNLLPLLTCLSLCSRLYQKHFGTDASRGEKKWMDDLVDVCMGNLNIINS